MSDYQQQLAELPSDWSTLHIEEVGEVISGGTPSRNNPRYWGGEIPWVTPGEVTGFGRKHLEETDEKITAEGLAQSGAKLLPPNSLLVTTRASLGAAVLNAAPATTNQGFKSITFANSFSPDYYYHWVSKLKGELVRLASGTTFLEISGSQFRKIPVPVPPRVEQEKIARILDTLDTQIQKTEALIAKLERVKEGLLHDLLTRGIDENGQLRSSPDQAPELYKESPLGLIPREWQYGQLQDFGQLVSGQHIPGELSNRDGKGVPYFTGPTDFYSGKTVTSNHTEFPQAMCSIGDLLITVKGSGCGKTAIASTDACISRQLMAFSFREAEKGFWRAFFSSNEKMINKIAEGGAIPGISRRQLLHISAACPKTEYEYIVISEIIGEHEKRQFSEARQLKKLIKQKSGLMDDLLTGRVRVTPLLDTTQATTPA